MPKINSVQKIYTYVQGELLFFSKSTFTECNIYTYKYVKARESIHQNFAVIISSWVVEFQGFPVDLCFLVVV